MMVNCNSVTYLRSVQLLHITDGNSTDMLKELKFPSKITMFSSYIFVLVPTYERKFN